MADLHTKTKALMNEQRPLATDDVSRGTRSATEEGSADSRLPPDPEVAATAKRRQFSSKEKRRILAAADRCTEAGADWCAVAPRGHLFLATGDVA